MKVPSESTFPICEEPYIYIKVNKGVQFFYKRKKQKTKFQLFKPLLGICNAFLNFDIITLFFNHFLEMVTQFLLGFWKYFFFCDFSSLFSFKIFKFLLYPVRSRTWHKTNIQPKPSPPKAQFFVPYLLYHKCFHKHTLSIKLLQMSINDPYRLER